MFTDTTNCPKIIDETAPVPDILVVAFGGSPVVYRRLITTTQFRFTSLTQAAADSIASRYSADTSHPNRAAASVRENPAGAYTVRVTDKTIGAWET